ncbi:MAG TPA: DUF4249 domain-containing protein [Flavobacteriaceae bacterium]
MFLFVSCIVPYEGNFGGFDDVLVVNSVITNENKRQEVKLTRSYHFEEEGPQDETGAQVIVVSNESDEFIFEETEPGTYLSIQPFAAQIGKEYSLQITTANGNSYKSSPVQLPVSSTNVDDVYAERTINSEGTEGVGIIVDSFDPSGNSKYYRHEFIVTFKIIAPYWSPYDAVFVSEGEQTFNIPVILREQEEHTCYGTNKSNNIIIKSTVGLNEDRLKDYNIGFIDRDNYILSYRCSVLVKQYVLSPETFSYYETLRGLSQSSDNIFSEDQPGFLAGNIFSENNPSENVAGFFEISTVEEKRIFFNHEDFFPGEELPPYIVGCFLFAPTTTGGLGKRELVNLIRDGNIRFYDYNVDHIGNGGPYLITSPPCGDCTVLGSNVIPDFWTE